MALKLSAIRYKQKTETFLITWPPTCWKPGSLFLVCKEGQKEDKSEFVTKSVGIIVTIIFMWKYLSKC